MTPNHRKLLELCIERGVERGVSRAHKHTDKPTDRDLADSVEQCLWEEIDEWFDWQSGVQ